ncbi:MAG: amidase family protein, partial [Gemmatimonadales bacterium]
MSTTIDRRRFMAYFSSIGLGGTLLPEALWGSARRAEEVTVDMIADAEQVAGLTFTDEERELMLEGLNDNLELYETLRSVHIPNSVHPAVMFDPMLPGTGAGAGAGAGDMDSDSSEFRYSRPRVETPGSEADLAYAPVTHLAELVRRREVSSVELTRMYLHRLARYDEQLMCVVSLTEDLAMEQARRADAELARGHYRGPLHGIPWGAKDLLSARGYRTTWGATPFEQQVIEQDATVVRRLEEAGAVLVAKLTLGALAWGDVWYGGRTRN